MALVEVLKGIDHSQFQFRYMLVESRDIDKLEAYPLPLAIGWRKSSTRMIACS